MCEHMQKQTQFLDTISQVATTYNDNWKAVKNVYWFLKWAVGLSAGSYGFLEAWKSIFPHK